MEKIDRMFSKIKKIESKDLSFITLLRLFNIFVKMSTEETSKYVKIFITDYYGVSDMPETFYDLFAHAIHNNKPFELFNIITKRNIYLLISYLKYNEEDVSSLEDEITPSQYYLVSKKHINRLVDKLKSLDRIEEDEKLSVFFNDELLWKLRRLPNFSESEYQVIAYKIYLSIGLDNGLELLAGKYGNIDYDKIYFLFSKLDVKSSTQMEYQVLNSFLFDNKKDFNNIMLQMLDGRFKELFLNFDYFYNNLKIFINKLGSKLSQSKVTALLQERFLARNVSLPSITGDVLEDMLSSYYNRYDLLETKEHEIHQKNYEAYNEFLRKKYKSSIPRIEHFNSGEFICEIVKLNDPRNLVLGYRAGNCFRINGEAAILFHNFLKSEHMRLISISTLEHKDFAMMLVMRNGNVLIGQGIEISKWAPENIRGKKLYDACRGILKQMMDYMNANGDEIIATIIGSSNSNVSNYNNQILPFLVNPILENANNYYNGIYNYQCLLDIKEGKKLSDIKLYIPDMRYLDEREPILRRKRHDYESSDDYMEIEKRLIALRFFRMQESHSVDFYHNLFGRSEIYTCCNTDWYITLFDDGTIDSFICSFDKRANEEYEYELSQIKNSNDIQKKKVFMPKFDFKKI